MLAQIETKMNKTVETHKGNLGKIRTGRAHAGILDHVQIDYYGSFMPINQVATVTVSDVQTVTVQPWETKMVAVIDKAIRESDLGLNPIVNGTVIRVPMPPLTEERRKELIKVVKSEGEEAKIAIRNIRRDANADLKTQLKDKAISEDEEKRLGDRVQKFTDEHIAMIDELTEAKEKELLKV